MSERHCYNPQDCQCSYQEVRQNGCNQIPAELGMTIFRCHSCRRFYGADKDQDYAWCGHCDVKVSDVIVPITVIKIK